MLEVEVKYRLDDRSKLEAGLRRLKAQRTSLHLEADHYFNAPDRDFRQSDEAFRLRRIENRNLLTYKGPKQDAATKTRPEIEVPLADGEAPAQDMIRLLQALGYRPVAIVRKSREVWLAQRHGFDLEVCLDDVENVGHFVELEIRAEPDRFDEAKAVVLATAAELGFTDPIRQSYLSMLLAQHGDGSGSRKDH